MAVFTVWLDSWLEGMNMPQSVAPLLCREVGARIPWEATSELRYGSRHIGNELRLDIPSLEEWDVEDVERAVGRAVRELIAGIEPRLHQRAPRKLRLRVMTERERERASFLVFAPARWEVEEDLAIAQERLAEVLVRGGDADEEQWEVDAQLHLLAELTEHGA